MNIRRELQKIENTTSNFGIATGEVFAGIVGTSGSRKEYSVLGDVVNLAARIMFWPKKFGRVNQINTCLRSKRICTSAIQFKYGGHCEFKGKSISIPIFEPIDPEVELSQITKRPTPPQNFLKLRYNPMVLIKEVDHSQYNDKFFGNRESITKIQDKIRNFVFSKSSDQGSLSIVIQGEPGQGKTHMARTICELLQKDQELITRNLLRRKDGKELMESFLYSDSSDVHFLPIFASQLNYESRMKPFAAWRPILRKLFYHLKVEGRKDKI